MKNHATLNRIYRLVWSLVNQCWVAVAETAKGQGKAATRRKIGSPHLTTQEHSLAYKLGMAMLLALAPTITMITPGIAYAGLEGGVIVGGQGTIVNPNLVIQNSARLAINAMGFNVGAGETFNLQQQSASDMALIRVLGQNPSDIFGTINAKGQLLISNPNGILFGKNSQVNVGGLIATTLNIDVADFMFGNYHFYKNKRKLGTVVNQGTLTAADGGYIALLAPEARNEGVINAHLGTAALLAGNKVTLNLNDGAMVSYAIDKGAINALAENKHLIQADGGQVFMGAKAANKLTTAVINNTGIIRAQTVQNQDGKIMLMGDMQTGTVNVGGTLDASAPAELNPNGGNGGFIETSAAHVKVADNAKVTTLAANGKNGTWLIDPVDFTIAASGGDMTGAAVSSALTGGNLIIQSSAGSAGTNGDVNVNDSVNWSANELTLDAQRNININANLNGSGTASLFLKYGQASAAGGVNDNYFIDTNNSVKVNLPAGDNFRTQKGNAGPVVDYTVITDLGAEGSLTGTDLQGMKGDTTKSYVLGADIDAGATSGWNGGLGWDPVDVGYLANFDGLGHTISNLTVVSRPIVGPVSYGIGLFGMINGPSIVQNLRISNANVRAETVGGLTRGAGILAGQSNNGIIRNVHVSGTVTVLAGAGDDWGVGGLTGFGGATVLASSSSAKVTNLSTSIGSAGGLMGSVGGTEAASFIEDSFATGEVTGGNNVGGLVGVVDVADIIHSWATGQVAGHDNVGGLVGSARYTTIRESYAQNISVTGNERVGGLVGVMDAGSNIVDSYANSPVTGVNKVGGLLGANNDIFVADAPSFVLRSYASGSVNGVSNVGGLVGYERLPDSATGSYWNTETTGQATSVGGLGAVGKTTAEMQTLSTFTGAGWDIDNAGGTGKVWRIYEGQTAPLLRYFLAPLTITANNATKIYDGIAYAGGNGLTTSATTTPGTLFGSISYGGDSQGAVNVGNYTIAALGLYAQQNSGFNSLKQNYDISYAPGTLAINPAPPVLPLAIGSPLAAVHNTCAEQGLSGAEAFVEIINGKFALTEVASFELDANEVVTDTSKLELSSNCMCDDTSRSFKNIDLMVLNGGVRMPDNRLSSPPSRQNIELIKTPRVIRSRSTL